MDKQNNQQGVYRSDLGTIKYNIYTKESVIGNIGVNHIIYDIITKGDLNCPVIWIIRMIAIRGIEPLVKEFIAASKELVGRDENGKEQTPLIVSYYDAIYAIRNLTIDTAKTEENANIMRKIGFVDAYLDKKISSNIRLLIYHRTKVGKDSCNILTDKKLLFLPKKKKKTEEKEVSE